MRSIDATRTIQFSRSKEEGSRLYNVGQKVEECSPLQYFRTLLLTISIEGKRYCELLSAKSTHSCTAVRDLNRGTLQRQCLRGSDGLHCCWPQQLFNSVGLPLLCCADSA